MELCDGGDLLQLIEKQTKYRELVSEKNIWKYFIQIWSEVLKVFTTRISSIGISSVPTYSLWNLVISSSVTWMFQRLPGKESCCRRRPGRHTMQAQRCGRISHTMQRAIYGAQGAFCTRWWCWLRHSKVRTWMLCTTLSWEVSTQLWALSFQATSIT